MATTVVVLARTTRDSADAPHQMAAKLIRWPWFVDLIFASQWLAFQEQAFWQLVRDELSASLRQWYKKRAIIIVTPL